MYDSQLMSAMAVYQLLLPHFGTLVAANLKEAKVILETFDLKLAILEVKADDADFKACLQIAANRQIEMIGIESFALEFCEEINIPIIRKPIDHQELIEKISSVMNCRHEAASCNCLSLLQEKTIPE